MMTGFLGASKVKVSTKRVTFDTQHTYIHTPFSIPSVILVYIVHRNVYEFIERFVRIFTIDFVSITSGDNLYGRLTLWNWEKIL